MTLPTMLTRGSHAMLIRGSYDITTMLTRGSRAMLTCGCWDIINHADT